MRLVMAETVQESGKNSLSPALRQHFNFIGYYAVKRDVLSQRFPSDKRDAALMWLKERDALNQAPDLKTMQRDWDRMTSRENTVAQPAMRRIDAGSRMNPASPLARAVSRKPA